MNAHIAKNSEATSATAQPTLWSIQEVAKLAGTTSRTLRFYGTKGLLPPTTTAFNGYRYYDEAALRRLQRILLLRNLGLGLTEIEKVLSLEVDETEALRTHVALLLQEKERIEKQISSVQFTLKNLEKSLEPQPNTTKHNQKERKNTMAAMFNGFDHTRYKQEVEERWGKEAYKQSDAWWQAKSQQEQEGFKAFVAKLNADWIDAAQNPEITPTSEAAQSLAARHVEWISRFYKDSGAVSSITLTGYIRGLAQMYPQDARFAANYGGTQGAEFVRDSLEHYLDAIAE